MFEKQQKLVYIITGLLVLVALIGGFILVGSPEHQRLKKLDETRSNRLRQIKSQIGNYYRINKQLPKNLTEIDMSYDPNTLLDPASKASFDYQVLPNTNVQYTLCAQFDTPAVESEKPDHYPQDTFSNHPQGKHCFILNPNQ